MTNFVYQKCDTCSHVFEIEVNSTGLPVFADGVSPDSSDATGATWTNLIHIDDRGYECDSTLIVRI